MASLRILLAVPYYEDPVLKELEDKIATVVDENSVDLVVLPEGYLDDVPLDYHIDEVREYAGVFNTAILIGMSTVEGYEIASYYNPRPLNEDTNQHIYIKHSFAAKIAYEYENYEEEKSEMFNPIRINGYEIGVCICYDMFFPLIPTRYVDKGRNADIVIDLSYGRVIQSKWENIAAGRSLESRISFLCTMGYDPTFNKRGKSVSIAFNNGKRIEQMVGRLESDGLTKSLAGAEAPGFAIIDFPVDEKHLKPRPITDTYYKDTKTRKAGVDNISISLGKLTNADISLLNWGNQVIFRGDNTSYEVVKGRWYDKLYKEDKNLRIMVLDLPEIGNPFAITENLPPDKNAYHLVCYCSNDNAVYSSEEIYTLAKLRAIENRVAIACYTPSVNEVIRANYEKMTSRFREIDGIFEFKAIALGGPLSVFTESNSLSGYVRESLDLINL